VRSGKGLFSLTTIFASFFGAALVAGAFAYYNYKFSEFKFINFNEFVFYTKTDTFNPKKDKYIVIFFSSRQPNSWQKISNLKLNQHILAIDYYNEKFPSNENVTFLRAGTKTLLGFIQRFNIYDVPVLFLIKRYNKKLFKQDSNIRKFDNIDKINSLVKEI